jgi:sulfate transporter 4
MMKEGFQMVFTSTVDDTISLLPSEDNSNHSQHVDNLLLHQRLTNHRRSLLRIHSDVSDGRSTRHVVPDELEQADGPTFGMEQQHEQGPPCSSRDWLLTLIPMCRWLQAYNWREFLLTDILAGVTVSVMVIPQSMSYAKIAGLPVQYGLYSSFVPIYAYAMFGSSRQLAVGPVALVSLLLNTGLTRLLEKEGITPETHDNYNTLYATLALQTSFLVGLCYVVMGLLRMGFVTILLSHAVISGFTSGCAIIIALSQAKYILGYSIPSDKKLQLLLKNIFASIEQFNYKTFLLGTGCILTMVGIKRLAARVPRFHWVRPMGPLLVTVISIILQATLNLEAHGIPIVGHIPQGLPKFTGEVIFPIGYMEQLSLVVFSIVIIGFMESIAIAKKLANSHSYQVDSSLELVALGMANLMSGFFSGFPVVGSFSRSAVNNDAGAMSGVSGIVTATLVGFVLLCLTPVFESLVRTLDRCQEHVHRWSLVAWWNSSSIRSTCCLA